MEFANKYNSMTPMNPIHTMKNVTAEARKLRTYPLEAVRATHVCKEEDIEYFFGGGECRVCHVWVADPDHD